MSGCQEAGKRLKRVLQDKDVTQAQLADLLGITQSAVSYVIGGRNYLSADAMLKLAQYLHVNLHWLITGRGERYEEHTQHADIDSVVALLDMAKDILVKGRPASKVEHNIIAEGLRTKKDGMTFTIVTGGDSDE